MVSKQMEEKKEEDIGQYVCECIHACEQGVHPIGGMKQNSEIFTKAILGGRFFRHLRGEEFFWHFRGKTI